MLNMNTPGIIQYIVLDLLHWSLISIILSQLSDCYKAWGPTYLQPQLPPLPTAIM